MEIKNLQAGDLVHVPAHTVLWELPINGLDNTFSYFKKCYQYGVSRVGIFLNLFSNDFCSLLVDGSLVYVKSNFIAKCEENYTQNRRNYDSRILRNT